MSSTNDSRDNANLKHFKSRSQQPKIIAEGPKTPVPNYSVPINNPPTSVNIYIASDGCETPFGSISDQVDQTRWRFEGVSPHVTRYESTCGRRNVQTCMRSGFQY